MKDTKFYRQLIDFLVKFYSGTISWKLGKWYMSGVKPYFGLFILLWGLLKVFIQAIPEGMTWFAWWDVIMIILFIPQFLGAFSMFAVNEQKRLIEKEQNNG